MNAWHFGVVVGINRYPDLRDLKRARGDAEKFADWLRDPNGGDLPAENVATIIVDDVRMPNGTPRENAVPTRRDVFTALYGFRKQVDSHIDDDPADWQAAFPGPALAGTMATSSRWSVTRRTSATLLLNPMERTSLTISGATLPRRFWKDLADKQVTKGERSIQTRSLTTCVSV
jgi:hypothetical protein